MRLHAQLPANIVEIHRRSFVMPTEVDHWRAYLIAIANTHSPQYAMHERLIGNLSHRLQLLEFETALLLHYRDMAALQAATLHICVLRLKIHQHAVLCHSILEGIGSHLRRADLHRQQQAFNPANYVSAERWRAAIIGTCFNHLPQQDKDILNSDLVGLAHRRDRVHLDRFVATAPLHYNIFTIPNCFEPTYHLFRRVMGGFNLNWPADTCLNENI